MGLKREIRLYIESELRSYDDTKKEWEQIQSEIICGGGGCDDGMPRSTDVGQPTERKALRLITNKRLAQLERTIKAFERVLTNLQEERFRLVVLRYWTSPQPLTDDGIAMDLNIDKATLYRWVNGIMLALAKEMGLVD